MVDQPFTSLVVRPPRRRNLMHQINSLEPHANNQPQMEIPPVACIALQRTLDTAIADQAARDVVRAVQTTFTRWDLRPQ